MNLIIINKNIEKLKKYNYLNNRLIKIFKMMLVF